MTKPEKKEIKNNGHNHDDWREVIDCGCPECRKRMVTPPKLSPKREAEKCKKKCRYCEFEKVRGVEAGSYHNICDHQWFSLTEKDGRICNKCNEVRLNNESKADPNPPLEPEWVTYPLVGVGGVVLETMIDREDLDFVSKTKWRWKKVNGRAYAIAPKWINGKVKNVVLHRLITKAKKGECVDHINHNTLDNRKKNLRICTNSQNMKNCDFYKCNTSGFKGVYRKGEKFFAKIRCDNKDIYLGIFKEILDAALVYDYAADKLFGDYSYTNKNMGKIPEGYEIKEKEKFEEAKHLLDSLYGININNLKK